MKQVRGSVLSSLPFCWPGLSARSPARPTDHRPVSRDVILLVVPELGCELAYWPAWLLQGGGGTRLAAGPAACVFQQLCLMPPLHGTPFP